MTTNEFARAAADVYHDWLLGPGEREHDEWKRDIAARARDAMRMPGAPKMGEPTLISIVHSCMSDQLLDQHPAIVEAALKRRATTPCVAVNRSRLASGDDAYVKWPVVSPVDGIEYASSAVAHAFASYEEAGCWIDAHGSEGRWAIERA